MTLSIDKESSSAALSLLEARLQQDLQRLCLPAKRWVPSATHAGQDILDVAIIGAGMSGLALAASLTHLGVQARLFDRSPEGFEGPWVTTARMLTLRSPKELTGPALGISSLTFRAWFEAEFDLAAWEALDKITPVQWADYLRWYRKVLSVDVKNLQDVLAVNPRADGLVELELADGTRDGATYRVFARHVVLANGRDGLGAAWVPPWAASIPRERWVHSGEVWSGAKLQNLRVAVIGGGASAMDVAATALEAGAARVDILIRRPDLPRINKGKGAGSPGMVHGFRSLPDDWKWRIRHYVNQQQVPPPHGSTLRVSAHDNAHFHLSTPVFSVTQRPDGSLRVETGKGPLATDFLIFSTGFRTDWSRRPEFSSFAPHVRAWQDRFAPAPGQEDAELAGSPDLGPLSEFQEKTPGACPGLERVHCYCYASALSQGAGAGDIPQVSESAQHLARGLAAALLQEDVATHYAALENYAEPELIGDEWLEAEFPVYDSAAAATLQA